MKWLSIGSLMCLVAGGFHISYGMMKDSDEEPQTTISVDVPDLIDLPDEIFGEVMSFLSPNDILHFGQTSKRFYELSKKDYVWKQNAEELCNEWEIKKAQKGFFTYQQIVKGKMLWDKFIKLNDLKDVSNDKKLALLAEATECGRESAIFHHLNAYQFVRYGLKINDKKGLELAQKYADKGSENAIEHLLCAYRYGRYRLTVNDPKGLELAQKYADKGSENAIEHLINAYRDGSYGLHKDPEGLVLAQKYADLGSEVAISYVLDAYGWGWYRLQANDQNRAEGLVLAQKYADQGNQKAKNFLEKCRVK